jgi:hypothetical protein
MEDLRAIVRHLRGFTMVELRNQPRVGDDARIGRENSGDVLPEHDFARGERASEQRRREIRPASPERGDAAVGSPPDESRDDDDGAAFEEGTNDPPRRARRFRQQRRCGAMLSVSGDDLGRINVNRSLARLVQRRRKYLRGEPFAARHEAVAGAWRNMPEQPDRRAQLAVFTRRGIDRRQQRSSGPSCREQRLDDVTVTLEQRGRDLRSIRRPSRNRMIGPAQQQVGDAGKRRGRDHDRAIVRGNQPDGLLNFGRAGKRRAAELPDLNARLSTPRRRG